MKNHQDNGVQGLESRLKEVLKQTGWMREIKTHSGNLRDPKDPWYLEYMITGNDEKETKKTKRKIDFLKGKLIDILTKNSEILDIKEEYNTATRIYKEIVIISPYAKITDETDFRTRVLNILIKEIPNYKRFAGDIQNVAG